MTAARLLDVVQGRSGTVLAEWISGQHYDRAGGNLDRHGVHFLTAYFAGV